MRNQKIQKAFKNFLEEHNAYEKYVVNVVNQNLPAYFDRDLHEWGNPYSEAEVLRLLAGTERDTYFTPEDEIIFGEGWGMILGVVFDWEKTPEGFKYWDKLSEEWLNICKEKQWQ